MEKIPKAVFTEEFKEESVKMVTAAAHLSHTYSLTCIGGIKE
ncbi:MAG: hypothetical protein WBK20_05820 [Spirochaetota bacterium]